MSGREDELRDEMRDGIEKAFDACHCLIRDHMKCWTEEYQDTLLEALAALAKLKREI